MIYTIGHSNRGIDDFLRILMKYEIKILVDIRLIPMSRANPQFRSENLQASLKAHQLDYLHLKGLGGFRRPVENSVNTGWNNLSFRGYADYARTKEFAENLSSLIDVGRSRTTTIMCAEAVPWRCHRTIVADYLLMKGFEVIDILDETHARNHKLTSFARVVGGSLIYPSENSTLATSENPIENVKYDDR